MTTQRTPRVANTSRRNRRWGTTLIETIVAFSLLATILSVSLPLVVRHDRLLIQQRHYRLALDELSNQLDRLMLRHPDEIPAALEDLRLSDWATDRLPAATLGGQLQPADLGNRLTLTLSWNEHQRAVPPLELSGWIMPATATDASQETTP